MDLNQADQQQTLRALQRIEGHTQQGAHWARVIGVVLLAQLAATLILLAVVATG